MDVATLDPATGQHDAEDLRVVIATGLGVDLGRATEFGRDHDQRVLQQTGAIKVADQRREGLVERRHLVAEARDDGIVHVPATVGQIDESHTRLNESAGEQHPSTGRVATVFVADSRRLLFDIKRFASGLRTDEAVGPIIERVHRLQVVRLFLLLEVSVDGGQCGATGGKAAVIDTVRQVEVTDLEATGSWITSQAERRKGRTEIAASCKFVWHVGNANVGRQVVARTVFVADDRPDAREQQRGTGAVAGKHVVCATFVSRFAVGHRTNDGQLVSDLGCLGERVTEQFAADLRRDLLHLTAILDRGIGLGIERFLMSHPTWQIDMNDRLGGSFKVLVVLQIGPSFVAKEGRKSQTRSREDSHGQEAAAVEAFKMTGIAIQRHVEDSTLNGLRNASKILQLKITVIAATGRVQPKCRGDQGWNVTKPIRIQTIQVLAEFIGSTNGCVTGFWRGRKNPRHSGRSAGRQATDIASKPSSGYIGHSQGG